MLVTADDELKAAGLAQTKRLATGLFLAAAALFVAATLLEERHAAWGFVRATAEAAMVGAIADWFAVTALFRHPLGLPIPHTAIVPKRKDQIGRSLGRFVQSNFLSREVLGARFASLDVARRLGAYLSDPVHARALVGHAGVALGGMLRVLRDDDVQALVEQSVLARVRRVPAAPLAGRVLELVTAGDRHQQLVTEFSRVLARAVDDNQDEIRQRIRNRTPWWMPRAVDDRIHKKVVSAVEDTLAEIRADPEHGLRAQFDELVAPFVHDLQHSPELRERGEEIKEELLQHPAVRTYVGGLWGDIKRGLLEGVGREDAEGRRPLEQGIVGFGEALLADPALLDKVDRWILDAVVYVVEQYRHEVGDLIESTVAAWDPDATSRKIELQIGRDLQFIRINGTVVGGLAGLAIHAVSLLL